MGKKSRQKYNGMYRIIIIPQKAQKLHVCNIILIYIQVGSVLVHPQNGVIGKGYNRMPLCRGQELDLPWTLQDEDKSSLEAKYLYGKDLNDCTTSIHRSAIGLLQWSTQQ